MGAPALSAEGAQFLSARGATQEASHGPLQRLLGAATVASVYIARMVAPTRDHRSVGTVYRNFSGCVQQHIGEAGTRYMEFEGRWRFGEYLRTNDAIAPIDVVRIRLCPR